MGETLDSRYDDIVSGKVKLIDGEEAFARLHARIEERAKRGSRAKFLDVLANVPDVEPEDHDRLNSNS